VDDAASRSRLLLRLPALSASAASNHRLIQRSVKLAFDVLARSASSEGKGDAPAADVGQELNELERMLDNERESLETLGHLSAGGSASDCGQPGATYLTLYEAEVCKGNFAAAAPWFDRYCDCVCKQALGFEANESPSTKKWRGPLNRNR
jgi:hypothetical protein